jgi:hypothetical protein
VIGRQVEGAGRLADDEEISRLHARLKLDAAGLCTIEDLGSTNGTYVNGAQISGPKTIAEGDRIEVGGTTLVLRELPGGAAAPVPDSQTRLTSFGPPGAQAAFPQTPAAAWPGPEQQGEAGFPPGPSLEPPPPRPAVPPDDREPIIPAAAPEPPSPRPPSAPPGPAEPPEAPEPPSPPPQSAPPGPAEPPEAPKPSSPPPPSAPPGPAEPPEAVEPPAPPPLALRLEVDFAGLEARLALDPGSEPVQFVFEAGSWRLNPIPPTQEGGPRERGPDAT